MKTGRPTKYKPEHCQILIDFFDIEPYYDKELPHYKDGEVSWIDFKRVANRLPTLRRFAKSINVNVATVYDWLNEKNSTFQKEFYNAFTQAKDLQKWFLIENGLNSCYNPLFAKFTAVNITDMRDKQESDNRNSLEVTFKFTNEDKLFPTSERLNENSTQEVISKN